VAAFDAGSERFGISRGEYLPRCLTQASARDGRVVTVGDLAQFEDAFADLADPR
jgi:hypothetical protein